MSLGGGGKGLGTHEDGGRRVHAPCADGSGVTKTFSVRVRVIFQAPSMRRKALLRRLERKQRRPVGEDPGLAMDPLAVGLVAGDVDLLRGEIMDVQDQRRIAPLSPEALEMRPDGSWPDRAAELASS